MPEYFTGDVEEQPDAARIARKKRLRLKEREVSDISKFSCVLKINYTV